MPDQVSLEDTRIDYCDWSITGDSLRYDISHLHPEWGFLLQTYRIDSQDFDGRYIYTSEFTLFKRGESLPSNFSSYARDLKAALWKTIFAVKRKFFEEVEPAIVVHFIKQPKSVADRFRLYTTYLNLPNYIIDTTTQDIVYIAAPPTDEGFKFFPVPFGVN